MINLTKEFAMIKITAVDPQDLPALLRQPGAQLLLEGGDGRRGLSSHAPSIAVPVPERVPWTVVGGRPSGRGLTDPP